MNYLERMTLSNMNHTINITDLIDIGVETLRIDNGCSLKKKFTELIYMNPRMVLYLIVNQVDSCHSRLCDPLT